MNLKDDLIELKCLSCNKNYQHKFDEKLKERSFNTFKFSNLENNKKVFIVMNKWMIGKNLIKHQYLKKMILTFT